MTATRRPHCIRQSTSPFQGEVKSMDYFASRVVAT
jgi:hypothetical protein